jgi:hypothetical protein
LPPSEVNVVEVPVSESEIVVGLAKSDVSDLCNQYATASGTAFQDAVPDPFVTPSKDRPGAERTIAVEQDTTDE